MQSDGTSFCGDVVLESYAWYIVIKTAFKTKNMKSEYFGIFMKMNIGFQCYVLLKLFETTSPQNCSHLISSHFTRNLTPYLCIISVQLYIYALNDLLINNFFLIRKFPGPKVMQTFEMGNSKAQQYCIRTAPIGSIYKSESRESLFINAQAKHLLMSQSHMVHSCILYLWEQIY